jgi:hypothetical protein
MRYLIVLITLGICNCCSYKNRIDPCEGFKDYIYKYPVFQCNDSSDCFNKSIEFWKIPNPYLHCSSTENLIQTCLNYPLFGLIWVYNTTQQGFDHIREYCNGFDEIYSRDDLILKIIEIYRGMNPDSVTMISDPVAGGKFMATFTFIELTIAQFDLIKNLTTDEIILLLENCISIYDEKSNIPSYGIEGAESVLAIMARIMYLNDYKPFINGLSEIQNLKYFIDSSTLLGLQNYNEINNFILLNSQKYLNELKNQ